MPSGAWSISALSLPSSSRLAADAAERSRSVSCSALASWPISPCACGQPSSSGVVPSRMRWARCASWSSGRSMAWVTSSSTRPPPSATRMPATSAQRAPSCRADSTLSTGALRTTSQSAPGTAAIESMRPRPSRLKPSGSIGRPIDCQWAMASASKGSAPASRISQRLSSWASSRPWPSLMATSPSSALPEAVTSDISRLDCSRKVPATMPTTRPSAPCTGMVSTTMGRSVSRLSSGSEMAGLPSCIVCWK